MPRKKLRARCSYCGKKLRLLACGMIPDHQAKTMASNLRYMRSSQDDYTETVWCHGAWNEPHVGRWRGKVGWIR